MDGLGVIESVSVELLIYIGDRHCMRTENRSAIWSWGATRFEKPRLYEQCLGNVVLQTKGTKKWNLRLQEAFALWSFTFNYRLLYLGGGNTN